MERLTNCDRALAVMVAAAGDVNDELTIVLNALYEEPEVAHAAAQRIVWKMSGLLNYCSRHGVTRTVQPMERLIVEDQCPALKI